MVLVAKRKKTSLFAQLSSFVNARKLVSALVLVLVLSVLMRKVPSSVADIENMVSNSNSRSGLTNANSKSRSQKWDSTKCAVMALAAGYGKDVYQRFVGSLRATGYKGHIILGVAPDLSTDAREYLENHNVTMKVVKLAEKCTYYEYPQHNGKPSKKQKCADTYPDYKIQWARFPLARDWLLECQDCTDGVMLTDTRDAYFQSDPFQYVTDPSQNQLMLFEEHPNQTTEHWITNGPVQLCRKYTLGPQPMLCSGSTMGSREGILEYADIMVEEFDYWKNRSECRSDMDGDDQSIHNYLYYTGRLPKAVPIPHRTGPIHVVGLEANIIYRSIIKEALANGHGKDLREAESWVNKRRFYGKDDDDQQGRNWLPPQYQYSNLTDPDTGFLLNLDGSKSPQVHQFDRFGIPFYSSWLNRRVEEWVSPTSMK